MANIRGLSLSSLMDDTGAPRGRDSDPDARPPRDPADPYFDDPKWPAWKVTLAVIVFCGAFWGGMTIGLVQQLSTLVLPTQLQNTAIFVVFLVLVFLRPQGFFGRLAERT